jgi:hypothetical protein
MLETARRALITMSHQCASNLLHAIQIRVLILGTSGGLMHTSLVTLASKLLDLFSLDPGTTCLRHLLPGSGTKWLHFTLR